MLVHAGLDVGFPGVVRGSPRMVINAMKAVGSFGLILAHMGGWRCWDEVERLLDFIRAQGFDTEPEEEILTFSILWVSLTPNSIFCL